MDERNRKRAGPPKHAKQSTHGEDMPAASTIPEKLASDWPPERWRHTAAVVAVSGGADSVALLRGLAALAQQEPCGRLVVAHFHHGLRGKAADEDEQFVVALAGQLGLECRLGRGDAGRTAADDGDGVEAAARNQRYDFLRDEAEAIGARYVAVAHTADDQAETILHHIVRGTGLLGVRGMRRARALSPAVTLIRPLLGVRRDELRAYLDAIGQPYRHDETNDDLEFTRNRLRHELLPLLADQYNPQVIDALVRLGRLADEAQTAIDGEVEALAARTVTVDATGTVTINLRELRGRADYLVRCVLMSAWKQAGWPMQSMGCDEWTSMAELCAVGGKRTLPGGVQAEARDAWLRLSRGG